MHSDVKSEPVAQHRLWPSLVTLVVALIGLLIGSCLLGLLLGVPAAGEPVDVVALTQRPSFLVASAAISQLALFLAIKKMPARLDDVGPAGWYERVWWRPERFKVLDVLIIAVGVMSVGSLGLSLLSAAGVSGGILSQFESASRRSDPATKAWLLLFSAIAPGSIEELAFRGLLQSRLIERWGAPVGITVASLLFGLWHFDLRQGLVAVSVGLWLGWCAHRQKTVVNVGFGHALNNAVAIGLSSLALERSEPTAVSVMAMAATAATCLAAFWFRTRPARP